MTKSMLLTALLLLHVGANATGATYHVGRVRIVEKDDQIKIFAQEEFVADILNGSDTWPRVKVDEDGLIYVGNTVINAYDGTLRSGQARPSATAMALPYGVEVIPAPDGFKVRRGNTICQFSKRAMGLTADQSSLHALQYGVVRFSVSNERVVVLAKRVASDPRLNTYQAGPIDLSKCRFSPTPLGNPDLLVELEHSRVGGYWITGSIEQTLLRSKDGRRWTPVELPKGLSALVSSYIPNDNEIWLAAFLPDFADDDPGLIYSDNAGETWRTIHQHDPLIGRLPTHWLEGIRRAAQLDQ